MMAKLQPAPPEFKQRIDRLVDAYFPDLQGARIEVQLRATPKGNQTVQAWGEADTPDNPREARNLDFTIWFARDIWEGLDEYERDALAFHELSHCRWDDNGKPILVDHDVEVFDRELEIFGLWWSIGASETLAAIENMPAPHGAEGSGSMPRMRNYQKPMQGTHGSTGAGSHGSSGAGTHGSSGAGSFGSSGAGNHGSTGAGTHGSTGAGTHGSTGARVAYSDPGIVPGGDYNVIDLGNGEVIELCPDCYRAVVSDVLATLDAVIGLTGI